MAYYYPTAPAYSSNATTAPAYSSNATTAPAYYSNATTAPAYYSNATTAPAYYSNATATPAYYSNATTTPAYYSNASQLPTALVGPISTSPAVAAGPVGYSSYASGSYYPGVYTPMTPEALNPPPTTAPPVPVVGSALDPTNPQMVTSHQHPGVAYDYARGGQLCLGPMTEENFQDPVFNVRLNRITQWGFLRRPARLIHTKKQPKPTREKAQK